MANYNALDEATMERVLKLAIELNNFNLVLGLLKEVRDNVVD